MKTERPKIEPNKKYWKSLEQLENQDRFNEMAEQEFQSSPLKSEDGQDGFARREFLKLMGASIAMSATACVRRPVQKIVPYANRPEDMILGVSNYYASSLSDGMSFYNTVVRTREGRPLKLEPNKGTAGLSAVAQAHVVSLYDPDRLEAPKRRITGKDFHSRVWDEKSWEKIDDEMIPALEKGSTILLTGNLSSPSKKALLSDFFSAFKGDYYSWDPASNSAIYDAQETSYGKGVEPRYRFDRAKYVVGIGADYLGTDANADQYSSDFMKHRKPGKDMSRAVQFESLLSLTGMNVDDRIRVKTESYVDVAMGLAYEIIVKMGKSRYSSNSGVKSALDSYSGVATKLGIDAALFEQIATDMWANKGQVLVVADSGHKNATGLQVAVNLLNSALEADGKTVDYERSPFVGKSANASDLDAFISELKSGKHQIAMINQVNLAFDLPSSVEFKKALEDFRKAGGLAIYYGHYHDETAELCDMILPDNHSLESWGDAEYLKGQFAIQQPTIRPLHNSRSMEQSLLNWAYALEMGSARLQASETYHDFVKAYWSKSILRTAGQAFEDKWFELLQTGLHSSDAKAANRTSLVRTFNSKALSTVESVSTDGMELVLYAKSGVGYGKYANQPWLQEFPDPVTKVTWDNYLTVSVETAKKMSIKEGDMVDLDVNGIKMKLPAYVQVGQHDDVFGLALGYGREMGGKVCVGVGFNVQNLQSYEDGRLIRAGITASITKTSEKYDLANVQGNNSMLGRQIVVEATLDDYLKKPDAGIHKHKIFSIWPKMEYKGHKWGMSIDLNSCTGCSSCMVACQAENNVPVVGKKYVLEGREMHWIRIDRYYSGDSNNPDSHFIPMLCQHCDNAPCETVCPVLATTHSPEGINEMTYNRCVGTRYCSNNCPYKVRRFNWFAYTKGERDLDTPREAYNPSVTVRSRGVMEKCTFCVHRIYEEKNVAKDKGVKVTDGQIKTACEQGCPTGAIVFGDMNDPNSRVSQKFAEARTYSVLEEYNAVPAVRYQTKIRNAEREKDHHGEGH
ncbi:MAG: TAT-variant-translocated molybdopterin oxidoreductase [Bdellovibrionales bacterium]